MALGSLLPGTGSSPTFMGSLGWQAGATFAPGAAVEVGWSGWRPCWTEEACVLGLLDIYEGKELAGNLPSLGASEMVKGLGERMGMREVVMVLGDHLRKISPISLCWGMSEKLPISAQEPGPSLARGTS